MEEMTVDNRPPKSIDFINQIFPVLEQVAIWLHLELKYHGQVEDAKIELELCEDFNCINLFNSIDEIKISYIGVPSLLKFFLKFKIKLSKKYTDAFYRRTNVSLNMKMTFCEFSKMLTPLI